jgi:hypothetical protein
VNLFFYSFELLIKRIARYIKRRIWCWAERYFSSLSADGTPDLLYDVELSKEKEKTLWRGEWKGPMDLCSPEQHQENLIRWARNISATILGPFIQKRLSWTRPKGTWRFDLDSDPWPVRIPELFSAETQLRKSVSWTPATPPLGPAGWPTPSHPLLPHEAAPSPRVPGPTRPFTRASSVPCGPLLQGLQLRLRGCRM